jgi:RecA-family ATPase
MRIDINHAFNNPPKKPDFVLPGFVAGTVGLLTSPGGVGKSFWITEAALCVASRSANESLLNLPITNHGPVVILNGEDPKDMIHERLHHMGSYLDIETRDSVDKSTIIESLNGQGLNILDPNSQNWLLELLTTNNARLCVMDTLSRCHNADENSNSEMGKVMTTLERIARDSGTAIVMVHHTSKLMAAQGRTDEQQSARGASLLVDNARWQSFIAVMSEAEAKKQKISLKDRKQYVRFGISKQNYGVPFEDQWYRRCHGGVFIHTSRSEDDAR